MEVPRFRLEAFLNSAQEVFHVARTTINTTEDLQIHRHNYAEVFWIKSGCGIHLINGEERPLKKGMLCMIRPNDRHSFKLDKKQDSLVITNIAFDEQNLGYYKNRYFPELDRYFWTGDKLPFCTQLDAGKLNGLSALADRLLSQPRDHLHLDYAMIRIFRLIHILEGGKLDIPHWLAYAMDNFNTPAQYKAGVQGFVALTGRSADHVNRVLQKKLKQTLTETITNARLQYARQQLIMTNSPVKSICFDCGFDSVSYFYRLFKKYTGQTPIEYRKKNHKIF